MEDTWYVRPVRPGEWPAVRELRLAALADPLAPVAFDEPLETARARPDAEWRDRTRQASEGGPHRQFVAVAPGGRWAGSVLVLVAEPGSPTYRGDPVTERTASLVGVYLRPEYRGTGAFTALFDAAVGWARALPGVRRIGLAVHEGNPRAEAAYRRAGFRRVRQYGDEWDMECDLTEAPGTA
jgi:RimJ/RimL family protein N-acetyltransferase